MNSATRTHIQNVIFKTQAAVELLDKADTTPFGKISVLLDDLATLVSIAKREADAALGEGEA